jgi:hypothetical protein
LLLALGGCVGNIGDGVPGPGGDDPIDPTDPQTRSDDIRRLSPSEYVATLRSLVGQAPVDAALTALAGLPNDRGENEFASMERGITSAHVDAYFAVAKAVADHVSADGAARTTIFTCLGGAAPDRACVEEAMGSFGRAAFRRPVGGDEMSDILAAFDAGAAQLAFEDGLALALMTIFQSPAFLYHLELGEGTAATAEVALSQYELASRLAYFLTGAPPDAALLDLAGSGALADEATYAGEIKRLLATPAAAEHVERFFTEWLRLDRIPVPQHSSEFLDGIDAVALAAETQAELQALAGYHVLDRHSDYATMLSSNIAVPSDNLALVYGVSPGPATAIADGLRDGLLTRAAFLLTSSETTHPIQRGAFVLRTLLCDDIAPPPPTADIEITPPPDDPTKTARERWTAQTSQPNCAGCHQRINAFGFALEKYDSLGRHRELENGLPIDDTVELPLDGELVTVTGGSDLSRALAESQSAQACMARKWFRFSYGRRETSYEVKAMVESVSTPGTALVVVLEQIAHSPGFRLRVLEGGQP